MAGIQDVAKLAGVSIATVSRALSGKGHVSERAKLKVETAAAELGYIASSSAYTLATGHNRNIGVVVPIIDRWFFATMLQTIENELLASGYDLTLYNLSGKSPQRERIFNEFLLRQRVDGVLTIAVQPSQAELAKMSSMGKPIIGVGGRIPGARSLVMDDLAAAKLAVEHLISLGHTRIANITGGPDSDREFNQQDMRHAGYTSALEEHGIEILPELSVVCDFTMSDAYSVAKRLLGDPRLAPTAIFCFSDEVAFGAIMAAKDLGMQVPNDVSIIGIDNHDQCDFWGLTTVNQKVREQGLYLATRMLEVLEDSEQPTNVEEQISWPVDLVVRSSTARPRSHN